MGFQLFKREDSVLEFLIFTTTWASLQGHPVRRGKGLIHVSLLEASEQPWDS